MPFLTKFLYLSSLKPRSSKFLASVSFETDVVPLEGAIFQPFEEFKKEAFAFLVGYNVSYVYHAMFAYFDRDNIALKGFAKFFKKSSEKQKEHAKKLIKYQNIRGGIVTLHSVVRPQSDFRNALSAMELALSLEKLKNEKLLNLHRVAERNGDPQMAEFIESRGDQEDSRVCIPVVDGWRRPWYESDSDQVPTLEKPFHSFCSFSEYGTLIRTSSMKMMLKDDGKFHGFLQSLLFAVNVILRSLSLLRNLYYYRLVKCSGFKFREYTLNI
ncbi:hypothetical protein FNV43_RR08756 [Rhamnella rubrinervis]|uniref:Ferritin n=1 Tax=Rhamnella rubrinervis TaxID=2594499 RepID=A0A8K0H9Z1_9ROSA|nr:hypothetical protein FNV43_RR08756 [Rhamnella rubrinervis]